MRLVWKRLKPPRVRRGGVSVRQLLHCAGQLCGTAHRMKESMTRASPVARLQSALRRERDIVAVVHSAHRQSTEPAKSGRHGDFAVSL